MIGKFNIYLEKYLKNEVITTGCLETLGLQTFL